MILNRKSIVNPTRIIPAECGIRHEQWTWDTKKPLIYNASRGFKPEVIPGVPLPKQVQDTLAYCIEAIRERSGTPDITRAVPPSGVRAALALDVLSEHASRRFSVRDNDWLGCIQRDAMKRLYLIGLSYDDERLLRVTGTDGQYYVRTFRGADLRGHYTVRIEVDEAMSRTKAGEAQLLLQAASIGAFNLADPNVQGWFYKRLGLHDAELLQPIADVDRANRENEQLAKGLVTAQELRNSGTFELDEHNIHIAIHRRFEMQPGFSVLDETARREHFQHTIDHIKHVLESQMRTGAVEGAMGPFGQEGVANAQEVGVETQAQSAGVGSSQRAQGETT